MADKANQAADVKGLTQAMAKLNPSGLEAATSSKSIKAYGQIAPIPFSLQNKSPATFGAFGVSGKPGPSGSFSSHAPDVEMGDSDVDIFHCVQHPVLGIDGDTELSSQDKADPKLTGKMAQATYVPSACLFVGNLPCNHTDRQLEDQVYVAFKKFGECYISVHRNGHAMPYCFVQFKEEEHAKVAFNQGAGLTVRGRKIRVEFVKAHRSIFFTRIDGKPVRPEEAIQALKQYSLDDVVIPGGFEKEAYELPEGVWVKFKYYGECQQALQDFPKSMSKYQLYYKQFGLNSKKSGGSTPRRHAALTAVSPAKTVPAKKVDNNENSLVANVIVAPPPFTTLELVHGQFLTFGHIISVAPFLILNDYTRVFVVMYSEVSSADKALVCLTYY
ncbi:hypothetical protein EJ06DRAFT_149538 [Trichodelitschia bisporula]|uniref:RRM domain-containing protein n=1 Tax=Trichodelitschia bisporula TaxID=703511 RepID=A0A6G1HNM9_9PEZI|nr:hypothetical protein EJ06DRAFT_149538 [Trichodelitschia bisporula]